MHNYHVFSGSHLQDNNSLFANTPHSHIRTTLRKLRSNAHHHPLVQTPGMSPRSVKKLRVDMLCRYVASYQLPTTGSKQQLAERLKKHISTMATTKNQCPRGRPAKATKTKTKAHRLSSQSDAPPTEPSPLESTDSSAGEEEVGSQPTEMKSSPKDHPAVVRGSSTTGTEPHPQTGTAMIKVSDWHIPRARRRHTSHSYSHNNQRRASSTASESEASPPRRKRHRHRDSSLSSSSTSSSASSTSGSSSSSCRRRRHRQRHHTRHR